MSLRLLSPALSGKERVLPPVPPAPAPKPQTDMGDEEFAYRTDRPVEELRKELEDLAAGWTVRGLTNRAAAARARAPRLAGRSL